ncbi:hypothetical protein BCR44DRAFT_35954 [Catenaria anguillulae PL171]|uniref:Uncharacterized protein n=1 Tax=Catenaria anguillulae PL171 TaxID=765915 RepID=A0A1Y2HEZ6_9FUNG|nr:hypothetical protein BCR44DRAFT_35954 [Catenaria anguillulae PL171]
MTGWPPGNDGLVMAYSLNSSSYRAFYIMLGVSCISGLSLGLQYVKRVRAQARDAGISSLIMPTVSPSTHDAAESCIEPPASDLLPAASASTGVMLNTRTAHGGGTTGAGVAQKHIRKHKRNVQNRIKQSWFVVFWILVALGTVVGFAVIMLSSLSYDMPPLFLNAFMTLFLKVFSGSVCLSIASMTRLVSASASSAGTSGQGMPVNDASMGTVL